MNQSGKAIRSLGAAKDCVAVVEDDAAVREALCLMLGALDMDVFAYASASEYLDDPQGADYCTCLVLDVRLPGFSGMELQKKLLQQKRRVPHIVFITGHADVEMAVEAMRNGAVDFLQKPFKEQQLLDSVQRALVLERRSREAQDNDETLAARLACLTVREREVLARILRGLRTKEIAVELGLATKTVEEHRSNLMRKMHTRTIAALVSKCNSLPSNYPGSSR
jgi:FixJ family two-component response regulator